MALGVAVKARGVESPSLSPSVVEQIGNTPLLRLRDSAILSGVEVYAKLEFFNPGGSVKDRPARRMIEDGERQGLLNADKIILDSTSGNTGIAYAMIGAAKGYRVKLARPSSPPTEPRSSIPTPASYRTARYSKPARYTRLIKTAISSPINTTTTLTGLPIEIPRPLKYGSRPTGASPIL